MTNINPFALRVGTEAARRRLGLMRGSGSTALMASALAAASSGAMAQALPNGPTNTTNVFANLTTRSTMTLTQTAKRAYAEWSSFNIGAGNTVSVLQGGKDYILVNRVIGTSASFLNGNLNAVGNVWVLNSNGITVGPNARFDVGGLMLSTASTIRRRSPISETNSQAFFQDVTESTAWNFSGAPSNSSIDVQAGSEIIARGGVVVFAAPSVSLGGTISQAAGASRTEVLALGATNFDLSLGFDSTPSFVLNDVTILGGTSISNAVSTSGSITASRVVLAAGATSAQGPGALLSIGGTVTATSAVADGADIYLYSNLDQAAGQAQSNSGDAGSVLSGGAVATTNSSGNGADIDASAATFNVATDGDFHAVGSSESDIDVGIVTTSGSGKVTLLGGGLTFGQLFSGGDVNLKGRTISGNTITGSSDIILEATAGGIFTNSLAASGDLSLKGESIEVFGSLSGRDIALQTTSGNIQIYDAISASDDIVVRASGRFTAFSSINSGASRQSAPGDSSGVADRLLGSTAAGNDIDIQADGVILGGAINATSSGSGGSPSDIKIDAGTGVANFFYGGSLFATGTISVIASEILSYSDLSLTTNGAATTSDIILSAPIRTGGSVTINATGNVETGAISSGVYFPPTEAARNVGAGSPASSGLTTDITISGLSVSVGALLARDVSLTAISGLLDLTGSIDAGRDILLYGSNASGIAVSSGVFIDAGRDVFIDAGTGPGLVGAQDVNVVADTGSIEIIGEASADRDIYLDALGDITTERLTTITGDVEVYGASFDVGAISARDIILEAFDAGGNLRGSLSATGSVDIYSFDDLTIEAGVLIQGGTGVTIEGGAIFADEDFYVSARTGDIDVTGDVFANRNIYLEGASALNVTSLSAGRDLYLQGTSVLATGSLQGGGDVAINATSGNISVSSVTASDDVVLRATGSISASSGIISGQATSIDSSGFGDSLAGTTLTGNDVDIVGLGLNLSVLNANGSGSDIRADGGTAASIVGNSAAGQDIAISGGTVTTGSLNSGRDIALLARSGALNLGFTSAARDLALIGVSVTATSVISGGRDIAVRATGGNISLAGASAGDDLVLRATGSISSSSGILSGQASSSDASGVGDALAGSSLTGNDIDIQSNGGTLTTVTASGAGSDVRIDAGTTGALGVGLVTAGQDIFLAGRALTTAGFAGGRDIDLLARGTALTVSGINAPRDLRLTGLSVTANGSLSGRDVAVQATNGSISLTAVTAQDDVVLRATGSIATSSAIVSGQATTFGGPLDQAGYGDALAGSMLIGNDLDVSGLSATLASLTAIGAGSDVRVDGGTANTNVGTISAGQDAFIAGGTVSTATVSSGRDVTLLARTGALSTTNLSAARDLSVTGQSVNATGVLGAGRDVAVQATGGTISLAGASAGDDVVLRATGSISSTSGIVSGQSPALDAAGAGDTLAGTALAGNDVDISGSGITLLGVTATGAGSDVRMDGGTANTNVGVVSAGQDIMVSGGSVSTSSLNSGRDITLLARSGALSTAGLTAVRDLSLTGQSITSTGTLSAGRDIAGRATGGTISLAGASAGDDLVLRATSSISSSSDLLSGRATGSDAAGVADTLAGVTLAGNDIDLSSVGATLASLSATGTGSDVVVDGGTGATSVGALVAFQDVTVSGGTLVTGSINSGRDITLLARSGSLTTAGLSAARDLSLTGQSIVSTGILSAGRDIAGRATGGTISLAGASAGDDLVLRATGSISSSSGLLSGQATGSDAAGVADTLAGIALAGNDIDVSGVGISASGDTRALGTGSDIRLNAGAGTLRLAPSRFIVAGQSVALTGNLITSTGFIDVTATAGNIDVVGPVTSGGNIILTALTGAVRTQNLSAGVVASLVAAGAESGSPASSGLSSDISILAGSGGATVGATLARDISINTTSAGAIRINGSMDAGRNISLVSPGQISVASGVLIDAGTNASLSGGTILADQDLDIVADNGAITISGPVTAQRNVLLDAAGAVTTAALTGIAGDITVGGANVTVGALSGGSISVTGRSGSLTLNGPIAARNTALLQAATSLNLAVGATVDARNGVTLRGATIAAAGDLDVDTLSGALVISGAATAQNNIILTSLGTITADALTAQTGSLTANSRIDLTLNGAASARGDVRLTSLTRVETRALTSTLADVVVDGTAISVSVGAVSAGRDVNLAGDTLTTGTIVAGRDAILLARTGILTAQGIDAGRDISLTGSSVIASSVIRARDIALRSTAGPVNIAGAIARDDIVIRSAGTFSSTGSLASGQSTQGGNAVDEAGLADTLAGASLVGNDIDVLGLGGTLSAVTAAGIGSDIRVDGGTGATTLGLVTAAQDINVSGGAIVSGALNGGRDITLLARTGELTTAAVTAVRDLSLTGRLAVNANGVLSAGRDIAVSATAGRMRLSGAIAGDDLVLRATSQIVSSGNLVSGNVTGADAAGVGDALAGATLVGGDIDAAGIDFSLAAVTASGSGSDVRLDGGTGITSVLAVTAGQDITISSGSIGTGALNGGRDITLLARSGALTSGAIGAVRDLSLTGVSVAATGLATAGRDIAVQATGGRLVLTGGANAGDDLVLRASGEISTSGSLLSGQIAGSDANGVADVLAGSTLIGGDIDFVGAGVNVLALTAAGSDSDIRIDGGTLATTVGAVSAGQDVTISGGSLGILSVSSGRDVTLLARSGALNTGAISAIRDLWLTGQSVNASGRLSAGRDIAARATGGAIALAGAVAGDDIALRATGQITSSAELVSGQSPSLDQNGVADALSGVSLVGNDIDISGLGTNLGALSANGAASDIRVDGGSASTTLGVVAAGQDVTLAGGSLTVGAITSGRDLSLTSRTGALSLAQSTAARDLALTGVSVVASGNLTAGRDIAISATGGNISLVGASAGDDVVLRATGSIAASSSIVSGAGTRIDEDGVGDALAGGLVTGNDVDSTSTGGTFAAVTANGGDSDVYINSGTAALSVGVVNAGRDIDLDSAVVGTGALTAGRDVDLIARAGALSVAMATAARDVSLNGQSVSVAGNLSAGRDIAVQAQAGNIGLVGATAGDDIVLLASGSITATSGLVSGQATSVDGVGFADALAGRTLVGNDIESDSAGGTFASLTANGTSSDVVIDGTNGILSVGSINAGQDIDLASGTLTTGALNSGRDIILLARSGAITTGALTSARDLSLTGNAVTATGLLSARDIAIRATAGNISLAGASARDDIALRATGTVSSSGALVSGAAVSTDQDGVADALVGSTLLGNDISINGQGGTIASIAANGAQSDVAIDGGNGTTSVGAIIVGRDAILASGSLVTTTINAGRDIDLTARTSTLTVGAMAAPRNLVLTGQSVIGGAVSGTDVAVRATGATGTVTLASVAAGDDIAIRAAGAIAVSGGLTSGTATSSDSDGAADSLTGTSLGGGNDIDVRGGSVSVGGAMRASGTGSDIRVVASAGNAQFNGNVDSAGSIALTATGVLGVGAGAAIRAAGSVGLSGSSLQAAQDLVVTSDGSSVTLTGPATVGRNTALTAGSLVETGAVTSSGTIVIDGASQASSGTLTGTSVSIRARSGGISLAAVTSTAGNITLDAAGTLSAAGLVQASTGSRIDLFANDLNLSTLGSLRAPNGSIRLYARRAVKVGGTDDAARFSVSSAEFGRIEGAELLVFGGQPSATGGAPSGATFGVELSDLTFSSAMQTLRLYTGSNGAIAVTGTIGRGSAPNATLTLGHAATDGGGSSAGAGWTPGRVRVSGTIGTNAAPFRMVSINAGEILIAPTTDGSLPNGFEQALIDAPEGNPSALPLTTDTTVQNRVFITSNELQLRSSGQIVQRNTDTLIGRGRGIQVGRLVLDSLTRGSGGPTRIALFGMLDNNNAAVAPTLTSPISENAQGTGDYSPVEGVAAAIAIRIAGQASPDAAIRFGFSEAAQSNYRINGCIMVTGAGCVSGGGDNDADGAVDDILDEFEYFEMDSLFNDPFQKLEEEEDPYAAVDEEPVTNSGGELEWPVQRRSQGSPAGSTGGASQ